MRLKVTDLGGIGMIADVDASEVPVNGWDYLLNLRCVHGRVEPMDGYADFTSWINVGSAEVYAHDLIPLETDTSYYLVYPYDDDGDGQCEAIYAYNGSTDTDITRTSGAGAYTGTSSDLWNSCHYNGLIILNNGSDCPQYWDGNISGDCDDLPWTLAGTDTWDNTDAEDPITDVDKYHAKVIRSFRNFLFALNITETIAGTTEAYPTMIHWSSIADPGNLPSWDYSDPTEESGRTLLTETGGQVLDCLSLGETLVIYKEDAIYLCAYVGGQFVFQIRVQSTTYGLWATNCVVDIGGRHVVLGDGVVYLFDGNSPRNILEGKLADNLFEQIDVNAYEKCFLAHNKEEDEVWICFPESGETWASKALIWNYGNNTWYYRTIPKSSTIVPGLVTSSDADAWDDGTETTLAWDSETLLPWEERAYSPIGDTLIAASEQLVQFKQGITSDPVQGYKTNIVVEDPSSWILTRAIYPHATGDAFDISVGGQDYIDGPVTWSTAQSFAPGVDYKLEFRQTSRIKGFKVDFTGSAHFSLNGYVADIELVGDR